MNNRAALSLAQKIGTVAGVPLILLVFIIVYGEARSILVTLLILTPVVALWTSFVRRWMQEREQEDAAEPLAEAGHDS